MRGICRSRVQGLRDSTQGGGDGRFFSRTDRKGGFTRADGAGYLIASPTGGFGRR